MNKILTSRIINQFQTRNNMAIPFLPAIITAVTTLGLGAMELFSKRRADRAAHIIVPGNSSVERLAESLQKRMDQLEESDVEQSRLIAELSKNLQKLAEALQTASEERAKHEALQNRLLLIAFLLIPACLAMSALAILH